MCEREQADPGVRGDAGGEIAREARATFAATVVPRDFDTIEIPFPERGEPRLVKGGGAGEGARAYDPSAMSRMVQVATAGDVTEAEQLQELLRDAGIEAQVEADSEEDGLRVLVPEDSLEAAEDAIEALSEPDDLIAEP